MDKDFYEILGLKRDASMEDVRDNYKKLILRWHPKLAKESQDTAQFHFAEISYGYEVLSDPLKRAFYDKYGWKKLQEGLFMEGELKGGYRLTKKPEDIFEKFYLSNNSLAKDYEKQILERGSLYSHAFGALNYSDEYPNSDLVVNVACTLSELYEGVAKKVEYSRNVLNQNGRTLCTLKEQKLLEIQPGSSTSTQLRYKYQGNETINRNKSDLVFKIVEMPHEKFTRQGHNLIYQCVLPLSDAIECSPIHIVTLDNRRLKASIDEIPNPYTLKELPSQGMPIPGTNQKGNLYIKFQIQFPSNLSEQVRDQLRQLLK